MRPELPRTVGYSWKKFTDSDVQDFDLTSIDASKRNIAIIATSSGFMLNPANPQDNPDNWVKGRAGALRNIGCEVYVPQFIYSDGTSSLVFEKNYDHALGQVSGSTGAIFLDRGVSSENGVRQIIECAESGLDIFPFMGGISFVDKTGAIINHFNEEGVKKPEKPIRIFNFSDVSHAAFLQSYHPDIFRFYSTASSRDLYIDPVKDSANCREEYDEIKVRNNDNLRKIILDDKIDQYPRRTLFLPKTREINLSEVQYFPMHSDMIMADAIDFDVERGGRGDLEVGIIVLAKCCSQLIN